MTPANSNQYPLYGSTLTIYTLSPLYHGSTSLLNNLALHSRRLRESITGDALRGTQLSLLSDTGSQAPSGVFRSCSWDVLGDEDAWDRAHPDAAEDHISATELTTAEDARGIYVEVRYEKAVHTAVLLGDARRKSKTLGFIDLPLLLVRMPAALKETFVNYLATAFDARVSPARFRSEFMGRAVEMTLESTAIQNSTDLTFDLGAYPKGIQLQLGFPSTTPQLKSLNVDLKQHDLLEFLQKGQNLWTRRVKTKSSSPVVGRFTAALEAYLQQNLALDLSHQAVSLAKVSLGPIALSNEGKIKIMDTSDEAKRLWDLLLEDVQRDFLVKAPISGQINRTGNVLAGANRGRQTSRVPAG
jgi:hypothetical protein